MESVPCAGAEHGGGPVFRQISNRRERWGSKRLRRRDAVGIRPAQFAGTAARKCYACPSRDGASLVCDRPQFSFAR